MSSNNLEYTRGEVIAEKYEVVDLLDESPLGVSYRCKHLESGNYVRLMLLQPTIAGREQKDRIINAFKGAQALGHQNLLKVGELGEIDGIAYVTMEDFEGTTLRELIQEYKVEGKQFEVKDAAQVVRQILDALGTLHADGLVLRALRPEYVLVKIRYTGPRKKNFIADVKLIGAMFWDLVTTAVLAEDEFTRGEQQYLAPELKSFEPRASARSDIYAAGVVFYEMLVGQAPVGTFQLPRARRPDLPEHVNTVVELALSQSPDDRYQSTADFSTDLMRTFEGVDDDFEKRPVITSLGWLLALVAVALIAIIVFSMKGDPAKEAEAADSVVRAEVIDKHSRPTGAEIEAITQRHPQNMIYVPPGPYVRGRLNSEHSKMAPSSEPQAEITEVRGFMIDAFEYANLKGAAPKFQVTNIEAEKLCAEVGKRLCTSDEWEKACKGPRNTVYSYGDTFDPEFCGMGLDEAYKSGAMADCKSGWGVFDMSGNFREWTSTAPKNKPIRRYVKGGLKGNAEKGTRCALSTDAAETYKDSSLSFRCCRDLDAPPVVAPAPE